MTNSKTLFMAIATCGLICGMGAGELQQPWVSDHAVIQAGRAITISGVTKPATKVEVGLFGRKAMTESDGQGAWSIQLGPFKAGEQGDMSIESEEGSKNVKDIVAGEVWLCSGQSNMEMTTGGCADAKEIASGAEGMDIRMLRQNTWTKVDAANANGISAVALSFAAGLAKAAGCPVGIAVAAKGGTRIEAWMPRNALEKSVHGRKMIELAESPEVKEAAAEDRKAFKPYDKTALSRWNLGRAIPMEHYETLVKPLAGMPLRGVVWYQGESNTAGDADARLYEELLASMISSWRTAWGSPEMPFIVIGLPRYEPDQGTAHAWDLLRESQKKAAAREGHATVVDTYDLGDPKDIHPKLKNQLGLRVVEAAIAATHNDTPSPGQH